MAASGHFLVVTLSSVSEFISTVCPQEAFCITVAGSPEGTCALQSCTEQARDQKLDLPAIGSIKVELFAVMEAESQARWRRRRLR